MDSNAPLNPQGNQNPEPAQGPLIRTMTKDIESLGKKPAEAPLSPQFPDYEPSPEMPLGMAPPVSGEPAAPPVGGEQSAAGPPIEIPVAPFEIPAPPTEPDATAPTPPPLTPARLDETVISEKTLTEFAPPQPPKKDIKKLALIAGIAGLIVIAGLLTGWFVYPKNFPAATPTPISVITPTPVFTPTLSPTP
ncbi:MAG: hypothetical protein Q8L57_00510 [bacterium]|nr:hypothetical protein [bacterium]